MAYLVVDTQGIESIFAHLPYRVECDIPNSNTPYRPPYWSDEDVVGDRGNEDTGIILPKGTIQKLIGRNLTWQDNPVELKNE